MDLYCILNDDYVISQPCYFQIDDRYHRTLGSGPGWVNIFEADRYIACRKDWHDKYKLYCIGKDKIGTRYTVSESIAIQGFLGQKIEICALEKK